MASEHGIQGAVPHQKAKLIGTGTALGEATISYITRTEMAITVHSF